VKDARIYQSFRLSKDGGTIVFTASEGNRPVDVFAADAGFKNQRRLTSLNPRLARKELGRTELVSYLDADGKKLHAVLYYPVPYEPGKKYPAVVNVYEQFFDDVFNPSLAVLAANGYAVLQPSVEFENGFPGEA
jgi:dipeptidyl aminopeptidase/acylaminoacyl peptidase